MNFPSQTLTLSHSSILWYVTGPVSLNIYNIYLSNNLKLVDWNSNHTGIGVMYAFAV